MFTLKQSAKQFWEENRVRCFPQRECACGEPVVVDDGERRYFTRREWASKITQSRPKKHSSCFVFPRTRCHFHNSRWTASGGSLLLMTPPIQTIETNMVMNDNQVRLHIFIKQWKQKSYTISAFTEDLSLSLSQCVSGLCRVCANVSRREGKFFAFKGRKKQ